MQPTTTSWMNKQSAIAMTKQTSPSRQVHIRAQTRMKNIQQKWKKTWAKQFKYYGKNTDTTQEKGKTTKPPVYYTARTHTQKN